MFAIIFITMPEFILNPFFWFYSGEKTILKHKSRDDYVTVDKIEFNQNTLQIKHVSAHNQANKNTDETG